MTSLLTYIYLIALFTLEYSIHSPNTNTVILAPPHGCVNCCVTSDNCYLMMGVDGFCPGFTTLSGVPLYFFHIGVLSCLDSSINYRGKTSKVKLKMAVNQLLLYTLHLILLTCISMLSFIASCFQCNDYVTMFLKIVYDQYYDYYVLITSSSLRQPAETIRVTTYLVCTQTIDLITQKRLFKQVLLRSSLLQLPNVYQSTVLGQVKSAALARIMQLKLVTQKNPE